MCNRRVLHNKSWSDSIAPSQGLPDSRATHSPAAPSPRLGLIRKRLTTLRMTWRIPWPWLALLGWALGHYVEDTLDEELDSSPPVTGNRKVGRSCTLSTDCVSGAFCDNNFCRCWSSHVHVGEFCWKKVNPDESGCTYDEQCDAVWPESRCSTAGTCQCAEDQESAPTREGLVCHSRGQCPTNGAEAVLFSRNSNRRAECYFFDRHGQELPGQFMGCEDSPDMYDCVDGMCCPTRAFACIQPMDEGQRELKVKSSTRWWYNSAMSACKKFEYKGAGGNANNFMTKQHCESYCVSRCPRGQPLLEDRSKTGKELRQDSSIVVTCAADSDCKSEKFKCTKVQAQSMCCPTTDYVCSEYGGLGGLWADLTRKPLQLPYSSGTNRFGAEPVSRWHWDRTARKCRPFRYLGQGGNFNNFHSELECVEFCSNALCPVGSPLRVEGAGNVECRTDQQCPRTHYCTNTACCPTSVTVCNLPMATGSACHAEPLTRFFYNPQRFNCQPFQYNGCGGNANNFASLAECEGACSVVKEEAKCEHGQPIRLDNGNVWKCDVTEKLSQCPLNYECKGNGLTSGCCPKKEYTCSIPKDAGKGCAKGNSTLWHFDAALQACRPFIYNGCDGNSNQFETKAECEAYCGSVGCPHGGNVLLDPDKKPQSCGLAEHAKCPKTHFCVHLHNSPFQRQSPTNATHFCCPTRLTICSLKLDEGNNCGEPTIRYGFDPEHRQCKPFMYRGCAGNENNFESAQICVGFCSSAACAAGELIYRERAEDPPFDCTTAPCPDGFVCVVDVMDPQKSVCCGTLNMGVCPEGQGSLIDERSQMPQSCAVDRAGDCPFGYMCVYQETRDRFYCCSPNRYKELSCPMGQEPGQNAVTGELVGCNVDSQCVPGFRCQKASGDFQSGLCCMAGPACPPTFALDVEQSRRVCNPLRAATCADGTAVCLYSEVLERFVCCRRGQGKLARELHECPGEMKRDPARTSCSLSKLCPPAFNCIRRNLDRHGICCKHKRSLTVSSHSLKCPGDGKPYRDAAGLNQICNERIECPLEFKCVLSESLGSRTRLCCSEPTNQKVECPSQLLPLSANGRQQTCDQSKCPTGYRCHEGLCCPTEEFACSVPFYAGVRCSSNKPVQRFYFNSVSGKCQPFIYNGCTPSANNFADEKTCIKMCVESEAFETKKHCSFPYTDPKVGLPVECREEEDRCEVGQQCVHNTIGVTLCCQLPEQPEMSTKVSGTRPFCGPGYVPVIDPDTSEPLTCYPFRTPCAKDQSCQYSAVFGGYLCCMEPKSSKIVPSKGNPNQPDLMTTPRSTKIEDEMEYWESLAQVLEMREMEERYSD